MVLNNGIETVCSCERLFTQAFRIYILVNFFISYDHIVNYVYEYEFSNNYLISKEL